MKFYETHFENYLLENKRFNLHPKLDKIYESLPIQINKLKILFFMAQVVLVNIHRRSNVLKSIVQQN